MTDGRAAAGTGGDPVPAAASASAGDAPVGATRGTTGRLSPGTPRLACPADVPEILRLIRELAEYERALDEVLATPEAIADLLFAPGHGPLPGPVAACHVIDADPDPHDTARRPGLAAIALWCRNVSTWLALPGVYLEDLYVSPAYRGRGYGRALLANLAALCVEHGYGRLDWSVLDWNLPAVGFYRALGAEALTEWTGQRLSGAALRALAAEATSPAALPA